MHPFLAPTDRPLVLASQSPRRAEILRMHGLHFDVDPAHVDEQCLDGEAAEHYAERVARDKARAVASRHAGALVLAADTIVVLDGALLAKPSDAAEACAMLERLAGRTHTVFSAVALFCHERGFEAAAVHRSEVRFRELTRAEIEAYVETGEPLDKAGAYGIQGYGSMLVEELEGEFFNVMGLPVQGLRALWAEFMREENAS